VAGLKPDAFVCFNSGVGYAWPDGNDWPTRVGLAIASRAALRPTSNRVAPCRVAWHGGPHRIATIATSDAT
jgi:hypothetical protein